MTGSIKRALTMHGREKEKEKKKRKIGGKIGNLERKNESERKNKE